MHLLKTYYFDALDASDSARRGNWLGKSEPLLIASWGITYAHCQPGSGSGSQAQESWHVIENVLPGDEHRHLVFPGANVKLLLRQAGCLFRG